MLIDWLTMRIPLQGKLASCLHQKIMDNMGHMVHVSPDGEIVWEKSIPDWEAIRSDNLGLFWSLTSDADSVQYLTIGASPSSLENQGVNVFGSLDIQYCAQILIRIAGIALGAPLPNWREWQCRRIDVTANYDMGSYAQVKQALALLLRTNAPRRRTNSDRSGGDTVYWNPSSDLRAGKAYHKGAHLRFQLRKGNITIGDEFLQLADRLLRLELRLGARWLRRLDMDWHYLTPADLTAEHLSFFSSLFGCGDVEVSDMGTLLQELEKVAPTKGRALAAHRTWSLIKTLGFIQARESMNKTTFRLHCGLLRAAGLSSADLDAGTVIPFRRRTLILGEPVLSWDELRKAA